MANLGEEPHLTLLRAVIDAQAQRLGLAVGDLALDTAGDSTGLAGRAARSAPLKNAELERNLPQPSGGKN